MAGGTGFSPAAVATALFRYAVFWGLVIAVFLGYSVWRLRAQASVVSPLAAVHPAGMSSSALMSRVG